jgi:hypothetical protein
MEAEHESRGEHENVLQKAACFGDSWAAMNSENESAENHSRKILLLETWTIEARALDCAKNYAHEPRVLWQSNFS